MNRFTKFALFVIFALVTYGVTFYGVQPALKKVAVSGIFNDETDVREGSSQESVNEMATLHCKQFIAEELADQQPIQFSDQSTILLTVGDPISGRFLINSNLELTASDNGSPVRKYTCQVKLEGGDISDIGNWDLISHKIWEEETETL